MIDDPPSEMFVKALQHMEFALGTSTPYNIELPRGSGKTSAAEMAILYLISTGRRKFAVIVSQNGRSAGNILRDIWRPVMERDTAFANDFPEVCLPFQLTNGSFRRRQTYNGVATEIEKNSGIIRLARLVREDGTEMPTSGSAITVRGVTSGVRGLKLGKMRPDTVLCDDLQTAESAQSQEQVEKIRDIINKDIMNLSSKGKLTVVMTSTPLCPDDLCDKIENDVNWKTTKYKAIMRWPNDMNEKREDGLWARYFRIFDEENINSMDHSGSLEFYRSNRQAMDEGAVLFNPNCFKASDGHISGLQALLEKRHMIGNAAFQAEMQMQPVKFEAAIQISPRDVVSKASDVERLAVPDGTAFVAASTDLNVSFAVTTTIVAFRKDMTSTVVYHEITPCSIDAKLPEAEYQKRVYELLCDVGNNLSLLGVKIDGWGIDASGTPFDAVTLFARNSVRLCGIPACAMCGRASHVFNPFVRSRLRDSINRTVLCGDAQEQLKSGSGRKYMFWDSDFYRTTVQKSLLAKPGSSGSCELYSGGTEEHREYAMQVCNERLRYVKNRPDGREEYSWKSKDPHDYLDSTAQAYAVAASQGVSGHNFAGSPNARHVARKPKRRVRIV